MPAILKIRRKESIAGTVYTFSHNGYLIMKLKFFHASCLAILVLPFGIANAADKEPISLSLSVKKGANPLGDKYATLEIKNNGDKPIEIWSQLPDGLGSCLDIKVLDSTGTRLSKEFYRRSISSPFEKSRLSDTIPGGKSIKISAKLFEGIDTDKIKPGKYKCRIRFEYDDLKFKASSEEVEIEVAKADIENRDK